VSLRLSIVIAIIIGYRLAKKCLPKAGR